MSQTVADHLLARLREWDVETVFGYAGDGINGLLAAWGRADNRPTFVQARHEEMAAFEAVAYAKFSGRVGVCTATSGPGAIHLLNGLYDAKLDHVPVVAIVGQTARTAMGGSYQQEVDLLSLFKDVASYVQMVMVPEQLPNVLDRAIRIALAERAPTAVIVPGDVQELEYTPPTHAFKMVPSSVGTQWPKLSPDDDSLARAAAVLNAGEKVAILAGQGARGARSELLAVADALQAGVAKALLGKDVLPDDLPFVTGSIGLLGTRPSYELMRDADTLLMVGSNFPYTQFLPDFGQARAVQIDIDGRYIGMRYPTEVNLVADAASALAALLPLLRRREPGGPWRAKIERDVDTWWRTMDAEAHVDADPVNPMRLFSELSPRLPQNAIVAADSGSAANWYARQLRFTGDMRGSLSGTLATMGPGVPYGIGAKFAHPDRPVIVFAGDGAMQMNGLAELITIKHYWQRWSDPRLIVAVLHNNDLNQVTWEMRAMEGAPTFEESQRLPDVDYAGFAASLGLHARTITAPDQLGGAWEQALSADRPTVLDVHTDPDVPPIPPHATFEQMKDAASALLHGDANRWGVVKEGLKVKAQELLPHGTS